MNAPQEAVRIRKMTLADVDEVLALERETAEAPHWNLEEYLKIAGPVENRALRRLGLVAEVDKKIAGYAVFRLLSLGSGGETELESIVVQAAMRGRGVGGKLMAALVAVARHEGMAHLELEVRASNAAAIRLYQRVGLQVDGRRPNYYEAPAEDAVLMSMRL